MHEALKTRYSERMAWKNMKITPTLVETVIDRVVDGRTLKSVCRDEDIPCTDAAIRLWLSRNTDSPLFARYAHARDLGVDAMVEEMLDIAHDGSNDWVTKTDKKGNEYTAFDHEHVQRSRLRVDALKWYIVKLAPKKYGDRVQTDVTSSDGSFKGMSQDQVALRLQQIMDNAQKRMEAEEKAKAAEAKKDHPDDDFDINELV